ncbi:MAG: hypothetical protein EBQ92_06530 [Proteobacteria bacterium]|nr:hypothetical protein [Pseudomonadota bacterium]
MKKQMLLGLTVALKLMANERPVIPEAQLDLGLTQGKPVAEYFQSRLANQQCATELQDLRLKHREEKNKLLSLIKSGAAASALDAQEKNVSRLRDSLIGKMEECGECATRPIDHRTVYAPSGTQRWYIADGSCYLPALGLSQSQIRGAFDKATARMLDNGRYTKQNHGIPSILLFDRVDEKTGKVLPPGPVESSPFLISLSVKGPSFVGIVSAFNYFIKNEYEKKSQNGVEETIIRFNQEKMPNGYEAPSKIYDTTAGGKKTAAFVRNISEVQGLWYFNSEGYFRYYTAADFGISLSLADDFARKTLLEALFSITDDSIEEAK